MDCRSVARGLPVGLPDTDCGAEFAKNLTHLNLCTTRQFGHRSSELPLFLRISGITLLRGCITHKCRAECRCDARGNARHSDATAEEHHACQRRFRVY